MKSNMSTLILRHMLAQATHWLIANAANIIIAITLMSAFTAALSDLWLLALRILIVGCALLVTVIFCALLWHVYQQRAASLNTVLFFESLCKRTFAPPSGIYRVEYSIPAASHFGVYESDVFLTQQQAQDAHEAVSATEGGERVFNSDYSDWKHRQIARQFSEILDTQHPDYRHPVGVLFSITLVKEQR